MGAMTPTTTYYYYYDYRPEASRIPQKFTISYCFIWRGASEEKALLLCICPTLSSSDHIKIPSK